MSVDDTATTASAAAPALSTMRYGWQCAVALAIGLAVLAAIRAHSFSEPLEADEAVYAVIAEDWRQGGRPYDTAWDNKPVGIFVAYRLAIAAFGYDETGLKIFGLLCMGLCAVLLCGCFALERLPALLIGALLVIWGLCNGLVSCFANGINAEVVMLPLLVLAFLLTRLYLARPRQWLWWMAVLSVCLAILVKQVALPFLLAPFAALAWRDWRRLLLHLAAVALIVAAVHIIAYAMLGFDWDFAWQQFKHNASYVVGGGTVGDVEISPRLGRWLRTIFLFPFEPHVLALAPFILMGFAAIGLRLYAYRDQKTVHLAAYWVAVILAIALPGKWFEHYYILCLPFVLLAFSEFCRYLPPRLRLGGMLTSIVYLLATVSVTYLRIPPKQISFHKYGKVWFVRDKMIGEWLHAEGLTGKRIFVDGSRPGILFYSRNRPVVKYFVSWYYHTMNVTTWDAVFAVLRENPPDICVLTNPTDITSEFAAWREANFDQADLPELEQQLGARVYLRKSCVPDT